MKETMIQVFDLLGVKIFVILHENQAYVCVGNDYQ